MKFWVDMDNAPHVHILRPVIAELERRGHTVEITARDYGQTLPLIQLYRLKATPIGSHAGSRWLKKRLYFVIRTLQLYLHASGKSYDAAISHGSRSQIAAAKPLGIPIITMLDYEHVSTPRTMCRWIDLLMIPDVIPVDAVVAKGTPIDRVVCYPGLKEDLYMHGIEPDLRFISEMGIDKRKTLVLVRPPATMAHYAVKESASLFYAVLEYLNFKTGIQTLLLPRTNDQDRELRSYLQSHHYENVLIPMRAYDGPSLVWYADIVISGGGTMNREAAALSIPVISIYQGPIGAVDRHLIETGRLAHITKVEELNGIPLSKTPHTSRRGDQHRGEKLCSFIVERILQAAQAGRTKSSSSIPASVAERQFDSKPTPR